jgi:hypothetical protein
MIARECNSRPVACVPYEIINQRGKKMFGFVSKKEVAETINSYIRGVQSMDDVLEEGALFFDWETQGDVRNSLREMRELLTGIKMNESD